jgi:Ca2+-transporting ATPase
LRQESLHDEAKEPWATVAWHLLGVDDTLAELHTSRGGLTGLEARRRREEYGPNELVEKKKKTLLMMFFDQFRDFMILVLIAAAVVSGIIGEPADTIAIVVIVLLNAALGVSQEHKAEKAMAALKKMAAVAATVMREEASASIPASELVPGDRVILEAGQVVPADMRVLEAVRLQVDEAALTGESLPVEKHLDALHDEDLPIGDRRNLLYKGTFVTRGRGSGVVTATGMRTELGRIASMIQEGKEARTPLQKRLASFGRKLSYVVLAICGAVFAVGVLRGEDTFLMLLTAVSLAVAAIPEALPAVVTISLALGAKKMVGQNALIRKLPAVETLGSVTYICSDKTGTLTLNRMTVEETWVDGRIMGKDPAPSAARESPYALFMSALALSNDALEEAGGRVLGDPSEVALYRKAKEEGYLKEQLERTHGRAGEIPFDSERKSMTTLHAWDGGFVSFTKGAVDVLVDKSTSVLTAAGERPFDAGAVSAANERMAADGLRVLGVAMRRWDRQPDEMSHGNVEKDLTFLGLVGMLDPPREEAREAVALCRTAGIRPVMITGDHPLTAQVIAGRLGIIEDDEREILTGRELEKLPLQEFEERVENIRVYARVAPEQKLKIIRALQDKGQFVAMTGDGVNDAPALKRANIGIAMGITGTDVSKEASHMILLDDNFATIVKAVKEGRRIFDNIRKFIKYTMTSNTGEIWTLFLAPLLGLPIPLLPIHILWINLVTDGLPGLALAAEPVEKDVMEKPPRHPRESIFAHGLGSHILWVGLLMGFVSIFTQAWSIKIGSAHWQTMVFTVLCLSQMGNVLAIRSERESLFSQGLRSNKPLLGAFLLTFALQMATIYVPFLNSVFKTKPLSAGELATVLLLSSVVFFAVEIEKLLKRRAARAVKAAVVSAG